MDNVYVVALPDVTDVPVMVTPVAEYETLEPLVAQED
jgi:hypothetical protein